MLTLKTTPRAQSHSSPSLPDRCGNCVHYLQRKLAPALNRATIFISALVGGILCELIDDISICSVDLYTVEAGTNGVLRCSSEAVYVFRNFCEHVTINYQNEY